MPARMRRRNVCAVPLSLVCVVVVLAAPFKLLVDVRLWGEGRLLCAPEARYPTAASGLLNNSCSLLQPCRTFRTSHHGTVDSAMRSDTGYRMG